MADAQTTGGYPRLAMVAAVDLPACAQLRPGDSIQFREISMDKAEELYLEKEKLFRQIQASVVVKFHT
jgi:antagonist of KipI